MTATFRCFPLELRSYKLSSQHQKPLHPLIEKQNKSMQNYEI